MKKNIVITNHIVHESFEPDHLRNAIINTNENQSLLISKDIDATTTFALSFKSSWKKGLKKFDEKWIKIQKYFICVTTYHLYNVVDIEEMMLCAEGFKFKKFDIVNIRLSFDDQSVDSLKIFDKSKLTIKKKKTDWFDALCWMMN